MCNRAWDSEDVVRLRSLVLSGPGDVVFLVGSREAALACDPTFVPVDAAIVGFVDRVNHQGAEG